MSSTNGTFTKVSGAWTVPTVTCTNEDRITSDWVGLDGFSSSTVEQDGTVSQCFEGQAVYYTWYEMYPAGTIAVGTSVAAGDKIKCLGVAEWLVLHPGRDRLDAHRQQLQRE